MTGRKPERELAALRERLGSEPPQGLHALTGAQLADLTTAITEARRRQREALAAAGDRALNHVPRFLRGPIRRVAG
ncbi:MAG: hypothetical protein QOF83_3416 [Solirubrobacteraceae bacterium]|jgi:hypothetical protein|nr:hypothetical protein [Solirubrobacteraceae bacterium]